MNRMLHAALAACAVLVATHAAAQITLYEGDGFRGRSVTVDERVGNLERRGFNDRASSVVVEHGRWQVCEHARFEGRCVELRRGRYDSLRGMGLNDRISSVRPIEPGRRFDREAAAPPPGLSQDFRRRPSERLYEAPVTSVRAVVGPPSQRCWVERQAVAQPGGGQPNVGGAIVGGLIGGILGHQVGGGTGKDIATAGGAVAGAAIGANSGRNGNAPVVERDVQRCQTVTNAQPEYWDVTYNYRGIEHRVQMTTPPGRTIVVNGNGEPRL